MKPFLISFTVGLVIGAFYGFLRVRSPAPPLVALIGLLGILVGEHLVSFATRSFVGTSASPDEHRRLEG